MTSKEKENDGFDEKKGKSRKQRGTYYMGDTGESILGKVPLDSLFASGMEKWTSVSLEDLPGYTNPYSKFSPYVEGIEISTKPTDAEIAKLRNQIQKLKENLKESDQKWKVTLSRHDLMRYFSENDTEAIIKGTLKLKNKGRCEMTILNCDIRNFTRFTNELVDQEYLTGLLNNYLIVCTKKIHECSGAVDKYMGDGVLAYFGWSSNGNHNAENACKAARDIIKEGDDIFESWYKKLWHRPEEEYLGIGIGIDSGWVYWDEVGHPNRRELSIIGPHVNLAARLQKEANAGDILISGVTEGMLGGEWVTKAIDKDIVVKGFEGKVDIFQLECQ